MGDAVDVMSGAVRVIASLPSPRSLGATWSRSAQILFSVPNDGMYLVPASGGFPERLAPPLDTECCGAWSHFLPDGRHFLYTVARSDMSACGIYIGEIGNPHGRLDGFAAGGWDGGAKNPFWSPDNPTIAFFTERRIEGEDLPDVAEATALLNGAIFAPAPSGRASSRSAEAP